jgi:DNA-binding MurR/RpiR family transcriptional regulator
MGFMGDKVMASSSNQGSVSATRGTAAACRDREVVIGVSVRGRAERVVGLGLLIRASVV